MKTRFVLAITLAGLLAAGCAQFGASAAADAPHNTTNPSDFPQFAGSMVVDVAPIDFGPMVDAIRAGDPKSDPGPKFRGNEILFSTKATLPQLHDWLGRLKSSPPSGFHVIPNGHMTTSDMDVMKAIGAGDELFATAKNERGVLVLVFDPKQIRSQYGPALDAIDKYANVPGPLRAVVDATAKKGGGYSVTEMLDRNSPIGVLLSAVKTLQGADRRAIVVLDEHKY